MQRLARAAKSGDAKFSILREKLIGGALMISSSVKNPDFRLD